MTGGSLTLALAGGMVATVNPCGFAMLPAYLSYFLGLDAPATGAGSAAAGGSASAAGSASATGAGSASAAGAAAPGTAQAARVALAVSAGFLAVFAIAGTLVQQTSVPIYENAPWISIVIGAALFALGVAMLAGVEVVTRLPRLDRGGRRRTVGSMFLFGVSYAIASLGCTLPLFLGTVAGTIERESLADGLVTFGVYALGMTLVLTALTVAIALARTSLVRLLRRAQRHVGRVAGGLVALAGAYVAYYGWIEIRTIRGSGPATSSNVTDTVTGWSYDVSGWIEDFGPVRLAVILGAALVAVAALLHLRTSLASPAAPSAPARPTPAAPTAPPSPAAPADDAAPADPAPTDDPAPAPTR